MTATLAPDLLVGWSRAQWVELTGVADLGEGLPEHRPGCGSRTLDPDVAEELLVRTRGGTLRSRRLEISALEVTNPSNEFAASGSRFRGAIKYARKLPTAPEMTAVS